MVQRIVVIAFIYIFIVLAWIGLGSTIIHRTNARDNQLRRQVGQLWGTVQRQPAPTVY